MTRKASNLSAARESTADAEVGGGSAIAFEDAALVERARIGDMQAFGALVAKYQDRVFNMVYRMCRRREDAEELAQEAFLKALEKISQFRGQSRFYTWLFRIAVNLVLSHRRKSGRIKFHSLSGGDDSEGSQAANLAASIAERREASPSARAMSVETRQRVLAAMEALDDEMRLVVILRDSEDMDYAQIAEVLSIPLGTVRSRLHRARCELKEQLADLMNE